MYIIEKTKVEESKELIISIKELEQSFPELAVKYKRLFGSKRPSISVNVQSEYIISHDSTDSRSDYSRNDVTYVLNKGRIMYYNNSEDGGQGNLPEGRFKIGPDDAVLVCHNGHYKYAELYVNSDVLNKSMLPMSEDLTICEKYVTVLHSSLIPAARLKSFIDILRGGYGMSYEWKNYSKKMLEEVKEMGVKTYEEAYNLIRKNLENKDILKINSAGSSQLTSKGKNISIQIKKDVENR